MKIAVCNRNTEKQYKNKEMSWEDIKERNRHPIRTSETMEEYPKLPKAQRNIAKDQGGFVGGWLRGGMVTSSAGSAVRLMPITFPKGRISSAKQCLCLQAFASSSIPPTVIRHSISGIVS